MLAPILASNIRLDNSLTLSSVGLHNTACFIPAGMVASQMANRDKSGIASDRLSSGCGGSWRLVALESGWTKFLPVPLALDAAR